MSLWSRITNAFGGARLNREIDEELESHIAEAIEQGRDPAEARRAFGSALRKREEVRDVRLSVWLDSLRADAVFGFRQLAKKKAASLSAILSLALAIGACMTAFRLIDAVLLRPLPVAHPERLYALLRVSPGFDGKPNAWSGWAYPPLALMRAAAKGQAEIVAASYAERTDLTFTTDQEMERAYVQYVSGWMFPVFGLQPALGRLLTENDDLKPGAHPVAVISYEYWARRFGADPAVLGRGFQLGGNRYEIVGVAPKGFGGTEPGTMTDVYLPAMMNSMIGRDDSTWMRALVVVKPGVAIEPLRQKLGAISYAFEVERSRAFHDMPKDKIEAYLREETRLDPAAGGESSLQGEYKQAMAALAVLVGLVLLIACANVANLMMAQAAARSREMALRVSIGAGRARLMQLMLMEGAWVATLASAAGALFTWWSTPFVVGMINPADRPVRLDLPVDWRVLAFAAALTLAVTLLFGLAPALRASAVKPAIALKGGDDPHSRRRLMHGLIAAQVAFRFLVAFVAGLFVETFRHLSRQPLGFSADRVLNLDVVASPAQAYASWEEVLARLQATPGVESVAMSAWPLLSGTQSNSFLSINGGPPTETLAVFLSASPGFLDTMRIRFLDGRDFLPGETDPGAAIVNETFAKTFLNGENPVGKIVARTYPKITPMHIVGYVADAKYRDIRQTIPPVAYVPVARTDDKGAVAPLRAASIAVRTAAANPMALASALRIEVRNARPGFRVSNIRSQQEIVDANTVRERLLATLAMFFAAVALLLAAVGLYGVLNYSVVQQRREIGIRLAIGAPSSVIVRLVTARVFLMVAAGAVIGLAAGLASVRFIETLFFQVRATDPKMLAIPATIVAAAALLASIPAVRKAVRIDPVETLRAD